MPNCLACTHSAFLTDRLVMKMFVAGNVGKCEQGVRRTSADLRVHRFLHP